MNIKISVKNLEKVENLFKNLSENVKPEVIDKSLDETLKKDIANFKLKLLKTLNSEMTSKVSIQAEPGKTEEVMFKKSDQEIIKHLTGVDLQAVSKTRDYNTLADKGLVVVSKKTLQKADLDNMSGPPTSKMSSGVNLRLPMSQADTFESQYARALDYFNNAMFVIIDNNGKTRYLKNPGVDLTQYVKIVCSNKAGDSERSRQVFDRHRYGTRPDNRLSSGKQQDFADWSILKDGLDVINKKFIDISDIVEKVKNAEYSEAQDRLRSLTNKIATNTDIGLAEKIDELKQGKKLDPTVESYNNVVKLVKNLKLEKTIRKDRTFYTLVSYYDENTKDYEKFQDRLVSELKMWKVSNEKKWVGVIVKSIVALTKKLLR